MAMKIAIATCVLLAGIGTASCARADPAGEARRLYDEFVVAENTSDFARLRTVLWDSPQFLWVTNGLSIWDRDAAIARMSAYHTAEIWHIEADTAHAAVVELNPQTAYLHVRLELTIGSKAQGPDHYRFLVSALCVETPVGWRIAALFTTAENPG